MSISAIRCYDGTNRFTFGKGLNPAKAESILKTSEKDLRDTFRRCEADPKDPPPDKYTPPPPP